MAKIFFGCSMRGGFGNVNQDELRKIPDLIESLGHELVSKHQVSATFDKDESPLTEVQIHDRDMRFLLDADYIIAEISNPSLGVGGEISDATFYDKPVLCIYQKKLDKSISAYIRGKDGSRFTPGVKCENYEGLDDLKDKIKKFIDSHKVKKNIIKAAAAMIDEKGRLLIVRKKGSEICINPGGKIEKNESTQDALKRELMEELKVDLISGQYYKSYFSKSAAHDPNSSLTLHLYITKWKGTICPASEIENADWMSKKDFNQNKFILSPTLGEIVKDLISDQMIK
ncbi:MAG: NUDIX domain-containing protein [archaeon]